MAWYIWLPETTVAVLAILGGVWRLSRRAGQIIDKVDELDRKVNTNHGKTIGEHVEALGADLTAFKTSQAMADQREHELVLGYVAADAAAHTEMRSLIMQVALEKPPPASS